MSVILDAIKKILKRWGEKRSINMAYDMTLETYKEEYGDDVIYQVMYNDKKDTLANIEKKYFRRKHYDNIEAELAEYIAERVDSYSKDPKLEFMVSNLISNLLQTNEYNERLKEYRSFNAIHSINKNVEKIKHGMDDLGRTHAEGIGTSDAKLIHPFLYEDELSRLCTILLGSPLDKLMGGKKKHMAESVKLFAEEKYTSPLFFDRNDYNAPTLKDVYTFQKFVTYGLPKAKRSHEEYDNLEQLIYMFLEEESQSRVSYFRELGCITDEISGLIILANAGMGKSSILSWIAYNRSELFSANIYRHVYFAKLRDLSDGICSVDTLTNLFNRIKDYIKDSLFLLDAFDEFTTNSDDKKRSTFVESLCTQIYENGGKLIITSRLNYFEHLDPRKFTYSLAIGLCPFTSEQATQWWGKYSEKKSGLSDTNFFSIQKKINNDEDRDFFGIPLVLYMIAYSGMNVDEYKTKYDLYTALFGVDGIRLYGARVENSQIKSPNYNENYTRFSPEESNMLFNVLCDIAYRIYQNENENIASGYILRSQVHKIIQNNYPEEYENFLSNYYSIASYFRGTKDGTLEFVHRSIFEYYLAKSIYRDYEQSKEVKSFEQMRTVTQQTNQFLIEEIRQKSPDVLQGVDLSEADFSGISFEGLILRGANFSGAKLCEANFFSADIENTYFGKRIGGR